MKWKGIRDFLAKFNRLWPLTPVPKYEIGNRFISVAKAREMENENILREFITRNSIGHPLKAELVTRKNGYRDVIIKQWKAKAEGKTSSWKTVCGADRVRTAKHFMRYVAGKQDRVIMLYPFKGNEAHRIKQALVYKPDQNKVQVEFTPQKLRQESWIGFMNWVDHGTGYKQVITDSFYQAYKEIKFAKIQADGAAIIHKVDIKV